MNILEFCLSPGFGGLELYVIKTSRWFRQSGIPVRVLARKGSLIDKQLTDDGMLVDYLSTITHHLPLISAYKLARYIDKHEIDVVHMHWGKDLFLAVLGKLLSKRKPKLVYTRQMAITKYKHDLYHKFVYKNLDTFICITKELEKEAKKYLPIAHEKIKQLYYGVDKPKESDKHQCKELLEKCGFHESEFNIGLFGRIEEGKGQHLLVEAVSHLRKNSFKVNAALIGHVMDEKYYQRLMGKIKQRNLEKSIKHLGFLENAPLLMGCFDAIVLASRKETFGLVLIEAMRAGTAVIGTNAGGVPEIIDNGVNGLLFEPDDWHGLSNNIEVLVREKSKLEGMVSKGRDKAVMLFDINNHFENFIKIIM